ncbi:thymidylate synthase [Pedobacter sp. D749]|uniref:thymidylate synthase n=1 Tax=Pedobacter sp. D749 TaxID=2856523 RepID=UPI001C58D4CC|nr:thymidylate synthase [Pedobacter sp. D749]QXU42145.1 thymidylate synthase [Pedobacter sp. D749]
MASLAFNQYQTLDDILLAVFEELLKRPFNNNNHRGTSSEIIGLSFTLTNPRARLSRSEIKSKAFSTLGELLWYLAGSNELKFIEHYIEDYKDDSDDGKTLYGAYGPRLFNMRDQYNQFENITKLLTKNPLTRKAVIQLFDAMDLVGEHKEIPCTCTIQFLIRAKKLNMYVSMRSNDAYKGLPHDIFAFTMLQEIMARKLGIELGHYHHSVGSLHLYDEQVKQATQFVGEGYQELGLNMAPMPVGDPWPSIIDLLKYEAGIRTGKISEVDSSELDDYWENLAKLLLIYKLSYSKNTQDKIKDIMATMDPIYKVYITPRIKKVNKLNQKDGE